MYRIRTPHYSKRDPVKWWALPDRIFFACDLDRFRPPRAAPAFGTGA